MFNHELLTRRLDDAIGHVRPRQSAQVVAEVRRRHRRRRLRRRAGVAVGAVACLTFFTAGIALLARSDQRDETVATGPSDETAEPGATPTTLPAPLPADVSAQWRALPPGPLGERTGFASAWTGTELVVWGGTADLSVRSDGAAYDPVQGTWRQLAAPPGPGRTGAVGVWTGAEVVLLGGVDADGNHTDALAYAPAADRWRTFPAEPLTNVLVDDAVWTGSEIVLTTKEVEGSTARSQSVLSVDPASGRWSSLPEPPTSFTESALALADGRVLLFSGSLDELNNPTRPGVAVAVWDLGAAEWTETSSIPGLAPQAFVAESIGDTVVAADYQHRSFVAPSGALTWHGPTDGPLPGLECPPTSTALDGALFYYQCGQAALIGPDGGWRVVSHPEGAASGSYFDASVTTFGDRVLVWGRNFDRRKATFWELSIGGLR